MKVYSESANVFDGKTNFIRFFEHLEVSGLPFFKSKNINQLNSKEV